MIKEEIKLKIISHIHSYVPILVRKKVSELIDEMNVIKKPVIPDFIADYIEQKKRDAYPYLGSALNDAKYKMEIAEWLQIFDDLDYITDEAKANKNQELFVEAWFNGYEVEEKKYYVLDKNKGAILYRNTDKEFSDTIAYPDSGKLLRHIIASGEEHLYQFTEKEIRDYDSRYLDFKEEVKK